MAIDLLALYNNALLSIGERKLASLTEARKPRYDLDTIYNLGAVDLCLELVKPSFASKTALLEVSVTSAAHDLDNVFTLPSDYVDVMAVFSDSKLDQPINRYIIENGTLACEYSTVYLRYISNGYALTTWTPAFARVVTGYLAKEYARVVVPDEYDSAEKNFNDWVEAALSLEKQKEPKPRAKGTSNTLSTSLRNIYNDALLIMGLPKIVDNNDDSNRREKLDTAYNSNLVDALLEDTNWNFPSASDRSQYDPSLEPEWGYQRVHQLPSDLHRIMGVFTDPYFQWPLKDYIDEGDYIYTDYDEIYIQYVSSNFIDTPANWPPTFRRLVAARLAKDAAPSLITEGADPKRADDEYEMRERSAYSSDAIQSPPQRIRPGNWVTARYRGINNRRRP